MPLLAGITENVYTSWDVKLLYDKMLKKHMNISLLHAYYFERKENYELIQ
jgi:hypothetical protein